MTSAEILKKYWGYNTFRPLQKDIVDAVIKGHDTLALLPTGGGKSVCFQVPALLKEGICVVVSPLVALMKDQVENLNQKGIPAIAVYAGMGKREIDILLDNCVYGNIKFLYLSPERLLSDMVRTRISYMKVNLIAVDEAHCISQWGYDFRPPYLRIKELREIHPKAPVLALTATATPQVREDIIAKLALNNPLVYVKSFARTNISYVVYNLEDKYGKLLDITQNVKGCGLVYVRNRRETAEVANFLLRNKIVADFYHAGLDKETRFRKQEEWKQNKTRIMVATNAFGMGIDKADVRFVVHLDLPQTLEAYYQEAGRCGRDDQKAFAVLLTNAADQEILRVKNVEQFPSVDDVKKVYHHLGNYYQLAVGAGEGLTLAFDLADFCKRFSLNPLKTISSLNFLERDGYIALSENVFLASRIMFTVSHTELYRFQIENSAYDPVIKTILRSYAGVFDGFVTIKESDLAKRLGVSYTDTVNYLQTLEKYQILNYLPQTDQPQLQFILPRRADTHMDIDVKFIQLRRKIQCNQINAVLTYATKEICRSKQLLDYLGETNARKCGYCDVCLAEKRSESSQRNADEIDYQLIDLLKKQHLSLNELVKKITTGTESERIERIQELLDASKIKTDGIKYYL